MKSFPLADINPMLLTVFHFLRPLQGIAHLKRTALHMHEFYAQFIKKFYHSLYQNSFEQQNHAGCCL